MLLARVAAASDVVAASSSRKAKIELLAACLREADDELGLVVTWMSGATRQRRTGLGWASLRDLPPAAEQATLDVRDLDAALDRAANAAGAGVQQRRRDVVLALFAAATPPEQRLISGLVSGELRQGAQAGVVLEAVAAACAVPAAAVRRAVTLSGDLPAVALAARTGGPAGLA